MMNNNRITIDWNVIFSGMIILVLVIGVGRILSRAISEKPALLPQTLRKLRFATTPLEVDRDTFAGWVETGKIQLLQAGGFYRRGRKPTLAILDDKIYAVVRYGPDVRLLSVRWDDLAEETVREVEEEGGKIAGVALLPQVKRKEVAPYKSTVECPICGEVIEISGYDAISRTEVLKRHIEKKHSGRYGKVAPGLLPQVLIEDGEPVPPEYRYLAGWLSEPLPEYSLLTEFLPAVEVERKVDAVLRQLKDGVERIQQSETFRLFLTTMSKFHDYSIGNQILIMLQKPDAAHVAGFNTWKDLGRWVKRGEKGISILAPVMPPRPTCPVCGARIPRGARFCPKCGERVEAEEAIEVTPHFFKVVYVFDISQTEGKPLPEFEVPVLTGEVNEELFASVMALAKAQGLDVSFESRPYQDPSIKGQYSPPNQIWVRPEEPRAQQLKTLLHEIAHYYSEGVFHIPRRDAETIAESAAFAIGAHYGFDTGVRSFPYVALWAQDKKVLEQNLSAIRRVVTTIIENLEKKG
jgi:predicted RNA-binding Zn-ribbon protein involved in translation (DUF1610 family)